MQKNKMLTRSDMADYIEMGLKDDCPKKHSHPRACAILGAENILNAQQAHEVWGMTTARKYHIPYQQSTLKYHAQKNEEGTAKWHLLFLFNWNIEQVIGKLQKRHMPGGAWDKCMPQARFRWGNMRPKIGYHLCNLTPSFVDLSQKERQIELRMISPQYSRARAVELAQVLVGADHLKPGICEKYTCEVSKFSGEFQFGLSHTGLELDAHDGDSRLARGIMLIRQWDA